MKYSIRVFEVPDAPDGVKPRPVEREKLAFSVDGKTLSATKIEARGRLRDGGYTVRALSPTEEGLVAYVKKSTEA